MLKYFIVSFYLVLFYIAISIVGQSAHALEVKDLYQASVNVDSQSSRERSDALKKAMQAVMLKVGGQVSVLDHDVLQEALKIANTYITQYHYKQSSTATSLLGVNQLSLVVSFDENKINKLFSQANLPIWGSLRPQILLWLIDEQGLHRTIISNSKTVSGTEVNFSSVVSEFSHQRGLPILMPLMDFDDANQITLSDLWGRFEEPIRHASARYAPEAIVVMRVSNSSLVGLTSESELNDNITDDLNDLTENMDHSTKLASNCGLLCDKTKADYVVDWTLLSPQSTINRQSSNDQQVFSQQYQGTDKSILLQQGLADITEVIYQYYALSTELDNHFVIDVANIESLITYNKLFDFLTDLSAVKSVTLISAKGSNRRFNLQLLGSKDALLSSLKLNKKLKQHIDPLMQVDESAIPIFYWEQR